MVSPTSLDHGAQDAPAAGKIQETGAVDGTIVASDCRDALPAFSVVEWKACWLNETWELSRALRHQDEVSRQVFDVCQKAIVGVPGYASWEATEVILGLSERSVRRLIQTRNLGNVHQGYFCLQTLIELERACLRTTLSPSSGEATWWEHVPLLIEREVLVEWFAWHAWGRLSLPDLSAWHRRFLEPLPTPGREVLSRVSFAPAEILRLWQSPPAAVRLLQNETGYFASSLFDGSDLVRLEWNRWILRQS